MGTLADLKRQCRELRPPLLRAIAGDVVAFCANRSEPQPASAFRQALAAARLCWQTDAFLGLLLYRIRMALFDAGVPVVPRLLHHAASSIARISIGNWAVLAEGIYIPHGQIVVDGILTVGQGCVLCPWTTLGLQQGAVNGPALGEYVFVGTGAKILGPVTIGAHAQIGANAVVIHDVPAGATAAGVPARVIERSTPPK